MKTVNDSSPFLRGPRDPRHAFLPSHEAIDLPRRKVIRIKRKDGIRRIQVRRGVVWLTGSPGREDVLVRRGQEYCLSAEWPFVLEALSDARVELLA
jgi:hypothetical protein